MRTSLIRIGNSQGIRIPKALLEESGIKYDVDIKVTARGLVLEPLRPADDTFHLSTGALARDWDTPEEDEAWKNL